MKNLVIVESPTKARTLSKYLGKDYGIKASLGHIKDLPKSQLGVDVEKDFAPQYQVAPKKKKVISELKSAAKESDRVFLATDPDREGEAIASHLFEALGSSSKFHRVVFHEITKDAVTEAFRRPRKIDDDLVDAQKARRVLDRLVGYKLSPLLWKKVRYGLSAGRVQSVAVRLIVEREREREAFKPEEYWKIAALLSPLSRPGHPLQGQALRATLKKVGGKDIFATAKFALFAGPYKTERTTIETSADAQKIIADLTHKDFIVEAVEKTTVSRSPNPPFITSTLQRAAAGAWGLPGKKTMRVAQNLYERGLITYHRTDSLSLSQKFVAEARSYLKKQFSESYLPEKPRYYKTKSRVAQEAHEAIRPTDVGLQVQNLGRDEARLYQLIWQRAVASQMADAIFDATTIIITAGDCVFEAKGSVLKFAGYLKVYAGKGEDVILPELRSGDRLSLVEVAPTQHFTSPPPRYTEASLVKDLEKFDIGRPSTYAPIISTIEGRGYISQEARALKPEDVGLVVNDLLVEHFPEIVDLKFTARMEDDLDKVADGQKEWVPVIAEFYGPFAKRLEAKEVELKKSDIVTLEETPEKCPDCGKPLIVKLGRYGKFLSCSGYPDCKHSRPYEDKDGDGQPDDVDKSQFKDSCPECGGELKLKEGRFGKFIACSNYPQCKYTKPYLEKIGLKCPDCQKGEVVVKRSRKGRNFFGCSAYPKCKYASWKNPKTE